MPSNLAPFLFIVFVYVTVTVKVIPLSNPSSFPYIEPLHVYNPGIPLSLPSPVLIPPLTSPL